MKEIRNVEVLEMLRIVSNELIDKSDYLTDLDRKIGDGDHGINMKRGFSIILEDLDNNQYDNLDISGIFTKIAMTMMSKVGGSSGPLLATFLLSLSKDLKGVSVINADNFKPAFHNATEAVKNRGKAVVLDKTMIDVLEPSSTGSSLDETLKNAHDGLEITKDIVAKKGRASYLGERSIGVYDPGASSAFIVIEKVIEYLKG